MKRPRGLRYVTSSSLSWRRERYGDHFRYRNRLGRPLSAKDEARVRALVIPPAWENVKISSDPNGHIQAIGTDARGRQQYIYHPDWTAFTQQNKFASLQHFGEVLPTVRESVAGHMRQHTLSRERVLATIVWLLEHTFIRVGNEAYAQENKSFGLTTLHNKHVDVAGNTITFSFKGKSNVYHELGIRHKRVAQTIRECIELPGYQLFQYVDENGKRHRVDSGDVNQYLKSLTGENYSAKHFRTWGGTTLAGDTLYRLGTPNEELPADKALIETVKIVSEHLGNTAAVCRQYYIHPNIISSYENNKLVPHFEKVLQKATIPTGLTPEEYATLGLL